METNLWRDFQFCIAVPLAMRMFIRNSIIIFLKSLQKKKNKKKSILEDLTGPEQYRKWEKYHRKAATKSGCNVPYKR